jgi:hypothetical protein
MVLRFGADRYFPLVEPGQPPIKAQQKICLPAQVACRGARHSNNIFEGVKLSLKKRPANNSLKTAIHRDQIATARPDSD